MSKGGRVRWERTVSRHEEDRSTRVQPASLHLVGHSDPGYKPGGDTREGQPWKLASRGGSNAFTCSLPSLGLFHLSA